MTSDTTATESTSPTARAPERKSGRGGKRYTASKPSGAVDEVRDPPPARASAAHIPPSARAIPARAPSTQSRSDESSASISGGTETTIPLNAWRPGFGIEAALRHELATVNVPVVGPVTLPGLAHLAWYTGVAALVVVEIVEWPVAALMIVGKALADSSHHELVRAFGEAVNEGV